MPTDPERFENHFSFLQSVVLDHDKDIEELKVGTDPYLAGCFKVVAMTLGRVMAQNPEAGRWEALLRHDLKFLKSISMPEDPWAAALMRGMIAGVEEVVDHIEFSRRQLG